MIFPFLPFMVHDFFPDLNRQEIGKTLVEYVSYFNEVAFCDPITQC